MDENAIQCVAYTDAACFCIIDDGGSFGCISIFVEISMADTRPCFNDRDRCILAYKIYQITAAARNDEIYISYGMQEFRRGFPVGRQEFYDMCIYAETL